MHEGLRHITATVGAKMSLFIGQSLERDWFHEGDTNMRRFPSRGAPNQESSGYYPCNSVAFPSLHVSRFAKPRCTFWTFMFTIKLAEAFALANPALVS